MTEKMSGVLKTDKGFKRGSEKKDSTEKNIAEIEDHAANLKVELSPYQKEHIKRQRFRLEQIRTLEKNIPSKLQATYQSLREKKLSALEVKDKISSLPPETQITFAKAYSAHALKEGGIEQYALHIDGLTGLEREHAIDSFIETKRKEGKRIAGFHFDLDKFRHFNDTYGHEAGDEVLIDSAQLLMQIRGELGLVGRNHNKGEEFTFLISEDDMTDENQLKYNNNVLLMATDKAEKMRNKLKELVFILEKLFKKDEELELIVEHVTASIGVAEINQGETTQSFRDRMEHAATYAKEVGKVIENEAYTRDQIKVFDESVERWHQEKLKQSADATSTEENVLISEGRAPIVKIPDNILRKREEAFDSISAPEKNETIEGSVSVTKTWSKEAAFTILDVKQRIDSGNFPEIVEFEQLMTEKGISSEEHETMKELWFLHASLAEVDIEYYGEKAIRDSLTGLYNRKEIGKLIFEALEASRENNTDTTVVLLDMDHFKNVNDTYGHRIGDVMLQEVAAFLNNSLIELQKEFADSDDETAKILGKGRSGDTIRTNQVNGESGRWGGEEFILLFESMNTDQVKEFIDNVLISRLESITFRPEKGINLKVSVSYGISSNTDIKGGYLDTGTILKQADTALYNCKLAGRNCSTVFTPDIGSKVEAALKEKKEKDEETLR